MSSLNQGRNEIRFNNSGGRCLLENWVEERQVQHLDPTLGADISSAAQLFKDGHGGVLTTDFDARVDTISTKRDSYRTPEQPGVRLIGKKQQLLTEMIYKQVSDEVHSEFNPPPPQLDYKSVTRKDFMKEDFVSTKLAPTRSHDIKNEQPVTFWTEHKDKVHGVSQIKTGDTPFRKNSSFSKPIDEYLDQPQPYEQDNYPMM